jgi:hypothetical protein
MNIPNQLNLYPIIKNPKLPVESCTNFKFEDVSEDIAGFTYNREYSNLFQGGEFKLENENIEEGFADTRRPAQRQIHEVTPRSYVTGGSSGTPSGGSHGTPSGSSHDDRRNHNNSSSHWNYYGGYSNPYNWWNWNWWFPPSVIDYPVIDYPVITQPIYINDKTRNKNEYNFMKYSMIIIIIILVIYLIKKNNV